MTGDAWDLNNVEEVKRDLGIEKYEEILVVVNDFIKRTVITYFESEELKVKKTKVNFLLEVDGMDFLVSFDLDRKKDK